MVTPTSNKQSTLTIRILGRDYPVACPPEERETLLTSAEFLSRRMQAIRKKGKTLGVDRIAVMAALNTTRELLSLQREIDHLRSQIDTDDGLAATAATGNAPHNKQIDDRLAQLQLRIDSVLEQPE